MCQKGTISHFIFWVKNEYSKKRCKGPYIHAVRKAVFLQPSSFLRPIVREEGPCPSLASRLRSRVFRFRVFTRPENGICDATSPPDQTLRYVCLTRARVTSPPHIDQLREARTSDREMTDLSRVATHPGVQHAMDAVGLLRRTSRRLRALSPSPPSRAPA